MQFAIFGLTVSSSWGNGHATLWRGLIAALAAAGHEVTFFERDVPYYASTRDLDRLPAGARLVLYADWDAVAADRQEKLQSLFIEPARLRPAQRFVLGGAGYPPGFPWTDNIFFVMHLPPSEHPAFFSSSRLTLNVTRRDMADLGHCPSGRLFEAAACGVPVLSDSWDGLADFFEPGREILIASDTGDVLAALDLDDRALAAIGAAARERVLRDHTSARRAQQLVTTLRGLGVGAAVAGTSASVASGA
jgi:spore maturation protein CgeB